MISSPKNGVSRKKKTTRKSFVVKIERFSLQNDDEIEFRRQNCGVFTSKWRRERVSSPKNGLSRTKMTTRTSFVVKKLDFPPQIGDENRARRHNKAFLFSKWRRPTFKLLLTVHLQYIQLLPKINIFAGKDFPFAFPFIAQIFKMRQCFTNRKP